MSDDYLQDFLAKVVHVQERQEVGMRWMKCLVDYLGSGIIITTTA